MSRTTERRRAVAIVSAFAIVFGSMSVATLAARYQGDDSNAGSASTKQDVLSRTGNAGISGRIVSHESKLALQGAVVHAVHFDTKQVFSSTPTSASGAFTIERVPSGHYDLAVEADGKLYVSNRVISTRAGETVQYAIAVGPPRPEDASWWSAEPNHVVPGLDRAPDGVGRIVEGIPGRDAPASNARRAGRASSGAGAGGGPPKWLAPVLTGVGLAGIAAVAADDDDSSDPGASPF